MVLDQNCHESDLFTAMITTKFARDNQGRLQALVKYLNPNFK